MGVAVSPVDGRIFVADGENAAIKIFSSSASSSGSRFKGAIYLSEGSKPISGKPRCMKDNLKTDDIKKAKKEKQNPTCKFKNRLTDGQTKTGRQRQTDRQ